MNTHYIIHHSAAMSRLHMGLPIRHPLPAASAYNWCPGRDTLHTCLGGQFAEWVHAGQIQRGDGDLIDAVILFYDLKGFLGVLNDYYEITADGVTEGGREVLRYIGDASLAIFPFERYADERAACQAALDVAPNAVAQGEQVNVDSTARGEPLMEFGIGLHTGTVMYGNIGTRERIEFTVIGKAASEAARIEAQSANMGITKTVRYTVPGTSRAQEE